MESPQERRERETLERCTTAAQRRTCERLHSEGKTAYPEKRQGKTVVSEFLRYCQYRDPSKIRQGLYHFSTMGAGGLNEIAHYNLDGFRHVYWHPHLYIDRLFLPEEERHWQVEHSSYVYTDGMTAHDVRAEMRDIVVAAREMVRLDYEEVIEQTARLQAETLARSLGMKLVPAEES